MHLTGLGSELRQTLRGLARRPARTALVVLTLAAGIAATTTIYTVVDAVIVRPLPYEDADRLVAVGTLFPGREFRTDAPDLQWLAGTSIMNFVDWQARTQTLDALEAVEHTNFLMPDRGHGPELVRAAAVTSGFLSLLDARVELGRMLQLADFETASPMVALLSHGAWLDRHGGDPGVVGRVEGNVTIVGVLGADVRLPEAVFTQSPVFWTPMNPHTRRYAGRGRRSAMLIGRLTETATLGVARAELASIQAAVAAEFPVGNDSADGQPFGAGVNTLHAETVGASARPLSIFFGGAALLLLIAVMNSANLLLLRGLEREGEVALRRALGAERLRLMAGLMLEGLALAIAAGVVGLALARLGVWTFLRVGPASIPRLEDVAINPRVLAISAVVSLGTGLVAALAPAVRLAWHANLGSGLRATGAPTTTRTGARLRAALVGAQLAAALVLGIGAMLLFSSLLKVTGSDVGFESRDLVAATIPMKLPGTDGIAMHDLWNRYVDELRAVPGVTSVVAGSDAPFLDPSWAPWVSLPGDAANSRRPGVAGFVVTPGFFEGIGTVVEAGREFGPQDVANGDPVVVVNAAFVRAHLGDRDPIGATIQFRDEQRGMESRRVVGVVGDIVQQRIEDGPRAAVYAPHTQEPWPYGATAMVRTTRRDDGLFDDLRAAAARFNPFVPVTSMGWMSDRVNATFVEPTFRAALFASFAAVSVFLAVIGLYGSLAHSVSRRTRELGVRMALGADQRSIFTMVIRQGAVVAVAGLTAGLAGALLVTRALRSFLYDVSPFDPWTFVAAAALVAGVSLAAALPPARRAARVDVATSLRD